MITLPIEISNEEMAEIKKRADRLGVRYEDLLRSSVRELVELSDEHIQDLIRSSVSRHTAALKRLA
jgi:hypothetical protein